MKSCWLNLNLQSYRWRGDSIIFYYPSYDCYYYYYYRSLLTGVEPQKQSEKKRKTSRIINLEINSTTEFSWGTSTSFDICHLTMQSRLSNVRNATQQGVGGGWLKNYQSYIFYRSYKERSNGEISVYNSFHISIEGYIGRVKKSGSHCLTLRILKLRLRSWVILTHILFRTRIPKKKRNFPTTVLVSL